MTIDLTQGNALVTSAKVAKGGFYMDTNKAESALASFPDLGLLIDGKSILTKGAGTELRDRVAGRVAVQENGVGRARSSGPAGNIGFTWPATPDAAQRLAVADYVMPPTYCIAMVVNPTNGSTTSSIRTLAAELPNGEYLHGWLAYDTSAFDLIWRHNSSGLNLDKVVPAGQRSLLRISYDADAQLLSAHRNGVFLGSVSKTPRVLQTGLWFGGRPGSTSAALEQKFYGMIEAAAVVENQPMYSAAGSDAAANLRGADLDALMNDVYKVY